MGKNVDGSAGGTTNSMEPLQTGEKIRVRATGKKNKIKHGYMNSYFTDLRFD